MERQTCSYNKPWVFNRLCIKIFISLGQSEIKAESLGTVTNFRFENEILGILNFNSLKEGK